MKGLTLGIPFALALSLVACSGDDIDVTGLLRDDVGVAEDVGQAARDMASPDDASFSDQGFVADASNETDMGTGRLDAGDEPDMDLPVESGPTRYPTGQLVSPITANVVDVMRSTRSGAGGPNDAVFMKVGASGTVNSNFLDCLGSSSLDLGGEAALQPTVDYFRMTDLAGATSWDRDTLAAMVGRTAAWVQTGAPSPLAQEISAINPRFALVNYGTNDMQQGITHQTALWPFWTNMWTLLTDLMADGIIPIVTGLNPRTDSTQAALWVPTYNEVTRAMAQTLQLPYLDLYNLVVNLDDSGLIGDGIHGNSSPSGACVFEGAGLDYNYNRRNLWTLRILDALRRTVILGESAPDRAPVGFSGAGTIADPILIDAPTFAHDADTSMATSDVLDGYPSCDNGQNESGPEVVYRLDLAVPTRLRAMVFDDDADIDIHHLENGTTGNACVARNDKIIQGTFAAGTHYFVLDTFVSSSTGERAGAFTFVLLPCADGDSACD